MTFIRGALAVSFFALGIAATYLLFAEGPWWLYLLIAIAAFVAAHFVWPDDAERKNLAFDSLEWLIELPIELTLWLLRPFLLLLRLFKHLDLSHL